MKKAILIVIDACRADALAAAGTPNIQRLMEKGSFSLTARTVTPSITLPAHFSIFTSMSPPGHNVLANTARPEPSPAAWGIMDLAKYNGLKTAAFFSWEYLRNLWLPKAVDYALCMNTALTDPDHDANFARAAGGYLVEKMPDFCFIYFERVDKMGHAHGFMSEPYLEAVRSADRGVGQILDMLAFAGLEDLYNIILQSDHGGIEDHHEVDLPEVMRIPWIAAGPDIAKKGEIQTPVSILDTAPTLAELLGIRPFYQWEGKAVPVVGRSVAVDGADMAAA